MNVVILKVKIPNGEFCKNCKLCNGTKTKFSHNMHCGLYGKTLNAVGTKTSWKTRKCPECLASYPDTN